MHIPVEDRGGLMGFDILPYEEGDDKKYEIHHITGSSKWLPRRFKDSYGEYKCGVDTSVTVPTCDFRLENPKSMYDPYLEVDGDPTTKLLATPSPDLEYLCQFHINQKVLGVKSTNKYKSFSNTHLEKYLDLSLIHI